MDSFALFGIFIQKNFEKISEKIPERSKSLHPGILITICF